MSEANKGKLGGANKTEMREANKSWVSEANKNRVGKFNKVEVDGADKAGVSRANIEVGKKAGAEVVVRTDNSTDSGNKITNQYTDLTSLAFAALAIINYANNFNFAILKEISLDAVISTSNKFLPTFGVLANITLKKKPNIYKSNLFLFTTNRQ